MSEIYRNNSEQIYLDVSGGGADATPVATVTDTLGNTRILTVNGDTAPAGVDERYFVVLNIADTQAEGELKVVWTFSMNGVPVTETEYYEVVTPYLSKTEVEKITAGTDVEYQEIEALVRHTIDSVCHQSFGYAIKTLTVPANGDDALQLPEHLISISNIAGLSNTFDPKGSIITGNGWYLKKKWLQELAPIVSDNQYWGAPFRPGGIIYAPPVAGRPTSWKQDYPFAITGEWGYRSVPQPVKEAAKLLINDYACMESAYRDRYLDSIKASDWNMQFSPEARTSTGNVKADQLLSDYIVLKWAVI